MKMEDINSFLPPFSPCVIPLCQSFPSLNYFSVPRLTSSRCPKAALFPAPKIAHFSLSRCPRLCVSRVSVAWQVSPLLTRCLGQLPLSPQLLSPFTSSFILLFFSLQLQSSFLFSVLSWNIEHDLSQHTPTSHSHFSPRASHLSARSSSFLIPLSMLLFPLHRNNCSINSILIFEP